MKPICKIYKNSWDNFISWLKGIEFEKGGVGLGYRTEEANIICGICIFKQKYKSAVLCDFDTNDMLIAIDVMERIGNIYGIKNPLGISAWVHTHPNLGIFLSNIDKKTFENFYKLDNRMMAIVVDGYKDINYGVFLKNNESEIQINCDFLSDTSIDKMYDFWKDFVVTLSDELDKAGRPLEYVTPADVFLRGLTETDLNIRINEEKIVRQIHIDTIKRRRKRVLLKKKRGEAFCYFMGTPNQLLCGSKESYINILSSKDHNFKLAVPSADVAWEGSNLPSLLRVPLIKALDGKIEAYESGIRSALLFSDDEETLFRLKGCGNHNLGFIIEEGKYKDNNPYYQVRGCQYRNTCLKEQITTMILREELRKHDIIVGNKSLGWWCYYDFEPVNAYCGLFATEGDLRLKDDILYSIESALPQLLKNINQEVFPDNLKLRAEKPIGYYFEDEQVPLINLKGFKLTEIKPDINLERIGNHAEQIKNIIKLGIDLNIGTVYWKLGTQVGFIKKKIEEAGFIWGSFYDPREIFHVNAHLNNLVLNINQEGCLDLSPIDFDLSISKDAFIQWDTLKRDFSYEKLLRIESRWIQLDMLNIVIIVRGTDSIANLTEPYETLRKGLRETMVSGYRVGYYDNRYEKLTAAELALILACFYL